MLMLLLNLNGTLTKELFCSKHGPLSNVTDLSFSFTQVNNRDATLKNKPKNLVSWHQGPLELCLLSQIRLNNKKKTWHPSTQHKKVNHILTWNTENNIASSYNQNTVWQWERKTDNYTLAGCVSNYLYNKNIWITLSHYCAFYKAIYLELGVSVIQGTLWMNAKFFFLFYIVKIPLHIKDEKKSRAHVELISSFINNHFFIKQHYSLWLLCSLQLSQRPTWTTLTTFMMYCYDMTENKKRKQLLPCCCERFHILLVLKL